MKPTHLEKIELGIVEALKAHLGSSALIARFPDRPGEFDMGQARKAVLVQYTGSRYRAPEGTAGPRQMRGAQFAVHLQLRPLGEALRALRDVEHIRFALQGQRIEGVELYLIRDGIAEQDAEYWRYVIEVACDVPAFPRPQNAPAPIMSSFEKEAR